MTQPGDPIHARGQDEPVPMHRGAFRQLVGDVDADPVAFDCFDRWTGGLAVVTPQMRNHAVCKFALYRFGDEVKFLDPVVHPVRKGPPVQRDHRCVVRP